LAASSLLTSVLTAIATDFPQATVVRVRMLRQSYPLLIREAVRGTTARRLHLNSGLGHMQPHHFSAGAEGMPPKAAATACGRGFRDGPTTEVPNWARRCTDQGAAVPLRSMMPRSTNFAAS
jgi:hypothetical protein